MCVAGFISASIQIFLLVLSLILSPHNQNSFCTVVPGIFLAWDRSRQRLNVRSGGYLAELRETTLIEGNTGIRKRQYITLPVRFVKPNSMKLGKEFTIVTNEK